MFRSEFSFGFDKIYFMHSFAHIDPAIVFKNFDWALKENGVVYIFTPNADWLTEKRNDGYIADPTVYNHYTMPELCNMFKDNGFKIQELGQYGEYINGHNERLFLKATR